MPWPMAAGRGGLIGRSACPIAQVIDTHPAISKVDDDGKSAPHREWLVRNWAADWLWRGRFKSHQEVEGAGDPLEALLFGLSIIR